MNKKTKNATIVAFLTTVIGVSATTLSSISFTSAVLQAQDAQSVIARRLGAIKAINGNAITLTPIRALKITMTIQPNARLLSIAPGEKDLKNATPIQLQDLHVRSYTEYVGQHPPTRLPLQPWRSSSYRLQLSPRSVSKCDKIGRSVASADWSVPSIPLPER